MAPMIHISKKLKDYETMFRVTLVKSPTANDDV